MFDKDKVSTTCVLVLPFSVKTPLILELAIIKLDVFIFHIIPMSYSYWGHPPQPKDPHLPVSNPFPYEVILGTTGSLISHLYTRAPFLKPQT
jgi:hypothetical protein